MAATLFPAVLALSFLLASCGGGSGTPAATAAPGATTAPVVFVAASQSASLNAAGGSLTLTAADGTRYQLDLPAGALAGDTTLSLTTQAPGEGQQFNLLLQPAGLVLAGGAVGTLTIQLPAGSSLPTTGGLVYDGTLIPFTRLPDGRLQVSLSAFAEAASPTAAALGSLGPETSTASIGASKRIAAVSATACAPTLASGPGLAALVALNPGLYGQCMLSAVQELANNALFPQAVRVTMSVAAFLQSAEPSSANAALAQTKALACSGYSTALDRARNTTATTTITLHNLIDPVMYWEKTLQQVGGSCAAIGLTDYQAVIHTKIGESLAYYGAAAPTITDVAAAPYVQAKAEAIHSVRSRNEILALNPPVALRSTLNTEVTQRAQPAVVVALLKAPWRRTRNTGNYDELISLKTSVGDMASLKDAAQYSGTELTVEALDNQNQLLSTLTGLGGVSAGQNRVTGGLPVKMDGSVRLTGPIKALSCPVGFTSSEELVLRFAGVEVRRLSAAPYLTSALQLNISDLRAAAGLAPENISSQPLTLERTGAACAGYWGASPLPLLTVTLDFASPKKVAFIHQTRDQNNVDASTLNVMNADGSGITALPLLNSRHAFLGGQMSWSPDRTRIATSRYDSTIYQGEIYLELVKVDGSGSAKIAGGGGVNHFSYAPSWSPDGTKIAFCRRGVSGPYYIHTINPDGSGLTNLNQAGCGVSWSPDSRRILFVGDNNIPATMNADGSGAAALGGLNASWVAWSPDGNRIAFLRPNNVGYSSLSIANNDGSGESVVIHGTETLYPALFAWSPNSAQIAFEGVDPGISQGKIYLINVDGTGLRQLTNGPIDITPAW